MPKALKVFSHFTCLPVFCSILTRLVYTQDELRREAAESKLEQQSLAEALHQSELLCAQWQLQCQSDKVSMHTHNRGVLFVLSAPQAVGRAGWHVPCRKLACLTWRVSCSRDGRLSPVSVTPACRQPLSHSCTPVVPRWRFLLLCSQLLNERPLVSWAL